METTNPQPLKTFTENGKSYDRAFVLMLQDEGKHGFYFGRECKSRQCAINCANPISDYPRVVGVAELLLEAIPSARFWNHFYKPVQDDVAPDAATVYSHLLTLAGAAVPSSPFALIAAERARHVTEEGCTDEQDDFYSNGELANAAACYAMTSDHRNDMPDAPLWPWLPEYWKPTPGDRVRELVKAGALIVAEIERLQRAGAAVVNPDAPAGPPTAQETETALLLVSDTKADAALIATWTDEQREQAFSWAMAVHFSASDNPDVSIPPRPEFVPHATDALAVE